MCFQTTRQKH